jgi:hypothetical protein
LTGPDVGIDGRLEMVAVPGPADQGREAEIVDRPSERGCVELRRGRDIDLLFVVKRWW